MFKQNCFECPYYNIRKIKTVKNGRSFELAIMGCGYVKKHSHDEQPCIKMLKYQRELFADAESNRKPGNLSILDERI